MADSARNRLSILRLSPPGLGMVLALILIEGFAARAAGQSGFALKDVDTPGLTVEALTGWGGYIDRSTPLPVSFLFRNDTDRSIEGRLTLNDPTSGQEESLGEIFLAPGSTRRFTSIQSLTEWSDCFASLRFHQAVLWRRELSLSTGKGFDPNVNYALFVDPGGRKLDLPGAPPDLGTVVTRQLEVAGTDGRPVQSLTVTPWQLPNHPGPLFVAQAMIFPEGADERDLNLMQWQAVAQWMCQGGVVFVHNASRDIIDRVVQTAPLSADLPSTKDSFSMRRFGIGALYEYDQPLLGSDSHALKQAIARVAAGLGKDQIHALVDAANFQFLRGGQANRNRNWIFALFGFYTLFAGGGALFLFRLNQRQVAIYTTTIVCAASLGAGLLGGYLRYSRGDLRWLTVTRAGAGGLVQIGSIEVQSAGSRNTRVAIAGGHADLQFIGRPDHNYYWQHRQTGYSPFVWQPNREAAEPDIYQIEVPMSPWGRRRCHATAYRGNVSPIEVELDFETVQRAEGTESKTPPAMLAGTFSLKLHNRLPFDLHECWLVVGASQPASAELKAANSGSRYGGMPQMNDSVDGMMDVYHQQRLQDLVSGASYDIQAPSAFRSLQNPWELAQIWPSELRHRFYQQAFRISRMGEPQAWLFGRIKTSPVMTIDEQRSDFLPEDGLHLLIQEISVEDLPATLNTANGP